jgi:transcriptional regulator with XRE-family HTH domain
MMDITMETPYTPDQLKAWCTGHKWTQQEAAANLGLSLRGYQDKEAGKRHISRQDMKLIGYINRNAAKKKATA